MFLALNSVFLIFWGACDEVWLCVAFFVWHFVCVYHFVMLGGMLAGHDEGNGKIIKVNGNKFIEFYGSSSEVANKKHYGGLAKYRSSEGRKERVKYRGKINDTILNILGGVRSSCTYVGAPSLKQLSKCTTFVRVSKQFNDSLIK